jgi:hypothetical protein
MIRAFVILLLGFVVTGGAWVMQCTGPKPRVEDVTVREPDQPGAPYLVDVQVRNTWRGHGEIQVQAKLHDKTADRVYEGQQNASLEPMDVINVVVEVQARRGTYEPDVELVYPVR